MNSILTIQQAIDTILAAVAVDPLPATVDTVKTGDPSQPLTGIVTTFLATGAVIARAADLGAKLIITHESTFYTHDDETDWLAGDPVYQAKRHLVGAHGIVIWRFHDYWHLTRPDGIMSGVSRRLGWELEAGRLSAAEVRQGLAMAAGSADASWNSTVAGQFLPVATIPPTPLAELARWLKAHLGLAAIRVVGPDALICRRVGLAVGFRPGKLAMATLRRDDVDALISGESRERETCEYLHDAEFFGRPKGLLILGHGNSEEAGMEYLVQWLRPHLPGVAITQIPAGDPLRVI